MPKLTFIEKDGTERVIEVQVGQSVMQAATGAGVEGIIAECGGECMCATCHCTIPDVPDSVLADMEDMEDETLEFCAEEVFADSRLTCQLPVTEAMDGLVFHVVGG